MLEKRRPHSNVSLSRFLPIRFRSAFKRPSIARGVRFKTSAIEMAVLPATRNSSSLRHPPRSIPILLCGA